MITQITCRAAHAGLFRFITPIHPYIHQNEFLKEIFISKNKVTAIPLSHVFKNQHERHRIPRLLAWIRSPPRCASHSMCLKSTHLQDAPPPPLLPAIHFSTKPGGLSRRIPYVLDVCGFIPIVPLTVLLWPLHFPQTRSSAPIGPGFDVLIRMCRRWWFALPMASRFIHEFRRCQPDPVIREFPSHFASDGLSGH